MVNFGYKIKEHCRLHHTSVYDLAKQLKISPVTLYASLKKNDMPVSRLYRISRHLKYNFFIHFIEKSGTSAATLTSLTAQNKELTAKVVALQKEVAYLHEINTLLKARPQT